MVVVGSHCISSGSPGESYSLRLCTIPSQSSAAVTKSIVRVGRRDGSTVRAVGASPAPAMAGAGSCAPPPSPWPLPGPDSAATVAMRCKSEVLPTCSSPSSKILSALVGGGPGACCVMGGATAAIAGSACIAAAAARQAPGRPSQSEGCRWRPWPLLSSARGQAVSVCVYTTTT